MYPNWLSLIQASLVLAELVAAAPSAGSSGVSAALTESNGISVPPPESRLKTRSTLPEPPVADQAEAGSESEAETLQRRWTIDSRCSQDKQRTIEAALTSAEAAAKLAADDAKSHDKSAMKRFYAYFGTDSRDYRKEVRERLKAIAKQCGRAKEDPLITCHDVYNRCNKYGIPLNAYVAAVDRVIILCPPFFDLPLLPTSSHIHDQATTLLHEMSHLPSVYSPNTDDIEGDLREIKRLEPQKAILNAETYNQYASSVWRHV